MKIIKKKIIYNIDKIIILCILFISIYGMLITYSSSNFNKTILFRKIIFTIIGFIIIFILLQIKIIFYKKYIYYIYTICNLMLLITCIWGNTTKGSQRWINLKIIKFQPSELIKIVLPITVSKMIHNHVIFLNIKNIIFPILIIIIPTILVYIQPDLGTSILIFLSGFIILYLRGLRKLFLYISIIIIIFTLPIIWNYYLHDYQKKRIFMLLNYNKDPLGSGYNTIYSKITIGSGGIYGKGIFHGNLSKKKITPENTTDFAFTILAEETGIIGIIILIINYLILIISGLIISIYTENIFYKLISSGLTINFAIYIFINIAMVNGILPVVGIPLPLISYGGSSLICTMSIFGILISINKNFNNNKNEKNLQITNNKFNFFN